MVHKVEVEENNPKFIRYRVAKTDGSLLVQDDITSMKLFVYEVETLTQKTANGGETLDVTDVVFNTAQTWDVDADGYNVQVPISGAYLADGQKTYRCEVKVTPTEGQAFYLDHVELATVETYSA